MYYDYASGIELVEFVYLALFERTRKGVLSDAEVKEVEEAQEQRGKSGSARVAYL